LDSGQISRWCKSLF